MTVVDASVVVRLLQNRRGDTELRERFGRQRHVHAPALIDAEVTSAIRGLLLTSRPAIQITVERAEHMLDDLADLPLVRYPMLPYQRRVLALRNNVTAYDAFYLTLAESLGMPLLTDDRNYGKDPAQTVLVETWPWHPSSSGWSSLSSRRVGRRAANPRNPWRPDLVAATVPIVPSNEFDHPFIAGTYDLVEGSREDLDLYREVAAELGARSVVDIGCGTGVLALLLAEDGYAVAGVEPAGAMLEVARRKDGADRVTWVHGDATVLAGARHTGAFDLATMTGNVAQVFTTDEDWLEALQAVHAALRPGGHLHFETRIPERRAWEDWAQVRGGSFEVPGVGMVRDTFEVVRVELPHVTFRSDNHLPDGTVVPSRSTLVFRPMEELERTLGEAGLTIVDVRDAPDRPGREWVVLARAV